MFCPKCEAEYRPGFTHCADCNTELVEHLPDSSSDPNGELLNENLREVWASEDQDECVSVCEQLRAAGIPFKVLQGRRLFFKGEDLYFKIGVPLTCLTEAKRTIEKGREEFNDDVGDQQVIELPAEESTENVTDSAFHERASEKWNPETATVEIWVENASERGSDVESCLRENQIQVRIEALDNGSRKFFVTPEDASQAREIVREIRDESPPP